MANMSGSSEGYHLLSNMDNKYLDITKETIKRAGKGRIEPIAYWGGKKILENYFGLHSTGGNDYNDFWRIFEAIKKRESLKLQISTLNQEFEKTIKFLEPTDSKVGE
jgi:hypothetical protein